MSSVQVGSPLPPQWLAALALPIGKIDPSHLAAVPGDRSLLAAAHESVWPPVLELKRSDLCELPGLVDLLTLSRDQFNVAFAVFGMLLLVPSVRQVISGHQLRAIDAQLGESTRKWVESADWIDSLVPSNSATSSAGGPLTLAGIRSQSPIQWNSVKHLGADATLIVAATWLWFRLRGDGAAIWALIRLRLPTGVLIQAESGKLMLGSEDQRGLNSSQPDRQLKQEAAYFFALLQLIGNEIHVQR